LFTSYDLFSPIVCEWLATLIPCIEKHKLGMSRLLRHVRSAKAVGYKITHIINKLLKFIALCLSAALLFQKVELST